MWNEYWPDTTRQIASNTGNAAAARKFYYGKKPANLLFLMEKRYTWMNEFIRKGDGVLELGCGIGVSRDFIRKDAKLILTDIEPHPWIDGTVDALKTRYPAQSFDAIICSNMIHHIAYPLRFFKEMERILKPGGRLIVQEVNCSIMTKILLRIMRHEGWSYNRDPFNLKEPCNDPNDPWSGNNAIPNLLFDNQAFNKRIPAFTVVHKKHTEFLLFPLSGGVVAKVKTVNLPRFLLNIVNGIDTVLVAVFPGIFALSRRIVLIRNGTPYHTRKL